MAGIEEKEGLNLPKSRLVDFFDDVEGKLALLTGLVDYEQFGLTLEDVRKPALVIGPPGIGKTCGILSSIREMNKKLPKNRQLGFKKILLGQTVVGSLSGIPVVMPDGTVQRIQIPDLPDPERDGEYGVLFLDEITTADEMQIQPALGLADDSRSLGEYTLPPHWIVVGAGNGPDCTNFVRLDDMTLTRFTAYDIAYEYRTDFRPYAHASGIEPDIIAFLNFSPDTCVRVESTDMDSAGKMFPCPRTWERLSIELKMRRARGKEVNIDDIGAFAGRIIGVKAGREFGAFMRYKKMLGYDPDRILAGKEKNPEVGIATETFHIILQALIRKMSDLLTKTGDGAGNYPLSSYQALANMMNWLLSLHALEMRINSFVELRNDLPAICNMMFEKDFEDLCPKCNEFFLDNAELICNSTSALAKLKI